jgi:hypothetical protein
MGVDEEERKHQSCRILRSNAKAMGYYIVVSIRDDERNKSSTARDLLHCANSRAHCPKETWPPQLKREKGLCIYLVISTLSELASSLGEQALGRLASFSTELACRVQELLSMLLDVLPIHDGSNMARWASYVTGIDRSAVLPSRRR